jgi:hypothetical protein
MSRLTPPGVSFHENGPKAELADALIDLYVDWREECAAVRAAYQRWNDTAKDQRATAFAAYREALDREERASDVYAELVGRVARATPD